MRPPTGVLSCFIHCPHEVRHELLISHYLRSFGSRLPFEDPTPPRTLASPPRGRHYALALQDASSHDQSCPEKHHGSCSQIRRPARTGYPPDAGAGDDARRTVDWAYALVCPVLVLNGVLNGVLYGHCSSASGVRVAARTCG